MFDALGLRAMMPAKTPATLTEEVGSADTATPAAARA
jgi:hypothetical protein